jgi:hypothetical protein
MIPQSEELTAIERTAFEELLGRKLQEYGLISLRPVTPIVASPEEREEARAWLLRFLRTVERPTPACLDSDGTQEKDIISDEDFEEILTEAMRSVRPSYRPYRERP